MRHLHPHCQEVEFGGFAWLFFLPTLVSVVSPYACSKLLLMLRNIFGLNAVSQGLAINWSWDRKDTDCLLPRVWFQRFQKHEQFLS